MEKMTRERMDSMTQEEFDQIPELLSGIGIEERIIDGKRVRVPVMTDSRAMWRDEDEIPGCVDPDGQRWSFVRDAAGKLHKQRVARRAR